MTSWRTVILMLMITSQSVVEKILTNGAAVATDVNSRSDHVTNDYMRRFVQCGVDRCLLYRTRVSVDLLLRCLEQHCASAFPQGSEKYAAGMEKKAEEVASKPSSECAAACNGIVENEYLECLSQSCGINQRPGTSAFCPSVCHLMSPENVKGCLQRYCPVGVNQEDQGEELYEEDEVNKTDKRWGNRLNWMKKWGNRVRVGRRSADGVRSWSKRWGSRVCLQAHCGSLANNRHAYVACGQNFCSRRR